VLQERPLELESSQYKALGLSGSAQYCLEQLRKLGDLLNKDLNK
jgi:hypothetical protein